MYTIWFCDSQISALKAVRVVVYMSSVPVNLVCVVLLVHRINATYSMHNSRSKYFYTFVTFLRLCGFILSDDCC